MIARTGAKPPSKPAVGWGEGRVAGGEAGVAKRPMRCELLPPRFDDGICETAGPCVLDLGHPGPHKCVAFGGALLTWETDDECDCCKPEDPDRCIVWRRA